MTIKALSATQIRVAAGTGLRVTDLHIGGGLLVVAGATILMGIITAEALYPGTFSTGANEISDLGGTRPPASVILQPSATIFDVSMALIGLLVLTASWFVHGAFGRRSVTLPLATLGIGALGVGLFPGNTGNPHAIFAMITFIAGGVAAVAAARVTGPPFPPPVVPARGRVTHDPGDVYGARGRKSHGAARSRRDRAVDRLSGGRLGRRVRRLSPGARRRTPGRYRRAANGRSSRSDVDAVNRQQVRRRGICDRS